MEISLLRLGQRDFSNMLSLNRLRSSGRSPLYGFSFRLSEME